MVTSPLHELLCDVCALTIPLHSDIYRLQTDASGLGIGAVLSVIRDDEEKSVAFYSWQLRYTMPQPS